MSFLNFFLTLHCLITAGALLAWGLRRISRQLLLKAAAELRLHYLLLALFALLLFVPFRGGESFAFHPVAHVEISRQVFGQRAPETPVVVLPGAREHSLPLEVWAWAAILASLAGLCVTALDYWRLARLLRRSVVFRQIGRVKIAVAEGVGSPFSARGLFHAWVVLPPAFLADSQGRRVALAHELQHHRSRDTLWCHAWAPLRALCFFHPLRPLWSAVVMEAQELACDEFLVSQRRRISAGDYSRCLVRAAETAGRERAGRAYAAAPSLFSDRRLLARRIESMYQKKQSSRPVILILGLVAGVTLAAGAWGAGHWVVDSRISGRKMVEMAEEARKGTDFPIVVNDDVLRELNRYLGTSGGREFIAKAEMNMDRLKPILDRQVAEHRVPAELLAMGLIESGFENLLQSPHSMHSAGVWQFIPSTARIFGMRVDEQVDERLDIERETDAAFRYLTANQARFGDWQLAVMAYNMGEQALDAAIAKSGTRDPWKLIGQGLEGDRGYLARFMAGVLILKNRQAAH
ncbi:MAG: transglycosylase SLT domain-containing protein [Bdellovibrionota bacterium]